MATRINLTYCGMDGAGPTVKEAKQDAARKIEAALNLRYSPRALVYRGHTLIRLASPNGYGYIILSPEQTPAATRHFSPCFHTESMDDEECWQRALNHLAQNTWQVSDGPAAPPQLARLMDGHTLSKFAAWAGFQTRYAEATARGLSNADAYDYAGRNPEAKYIVLPAEVTA
jgi:hypothetical protein